MRAKQAFDGRFMGTERFIKQITIGEVFQGETMPVFPIIKDLAAQQMLTNPPTVLVSRFLQLIVSIHQAIPVCYFKGGMVKRRFSSAEQE